MDNNNNADLSIRFIQWNSATDFDLVAMDDNHPNNPKALGAMHKEDGWHVFNHSLYEPVARVRAERMTKIFAEAQADIIAVQEIPESLSKILGKGYEVHSGDARRDTAIAWNTKKFTLAKWIESKEATIVDLKQVATGRAIRVVSAHLTGVDDVNKWRNDSVEGDNQLRGILQTATANTVGVDTIIFGGDLNVTAGHGRMSLLRDGEFKLDGREEQTVFNRYKAAERNQAKGSQKYSVEYLYKIDHVATRLINTKLTATWEWLPELAKKLTPIGNTEVNPSDHAMMIGDLTLGTKSFWRGLFG